MLRPAAVCQATGLTTPTLYRYIKKSLFPPPVPCGRRAVAWPESEVRRVRDTWAQGADDDTVRAVVADIIAAREARAAA